MLKDWVARLLQLSGRSHLASFAQGLLHLGRPSSVAFPPELVEQGIAIALSGLSNTMAIQSNPDWVWPVWVERQTDPLDEAFVPTGLNLITTNLTLRNWTSVGVDGCSKEAMVDPVGMITPAPWSWSVLPCLEGMGGIHDPARLHRQVVQSLVPAPGTGVRTTLKDVQDLDWSWDVFGAELEGHPAVVVQIHVGNSGDQPRVFWPGICLRPCNPLSLGHIRTLRADALHVRVNGNSSIHFSKPADRIVVSDRHNGDPLQRPGAGLPLRVLRSRSGMATLLASWKADLAPGETWEGSVVLPLTEDRGGPHVVGRRAVSHSRERAEAERRRERARGTSLSIPDPVLQAGWDAVRSRMHVFDDGDRFTPGTFLYHEHWFRDAAFLALGFENIGRGDRVGPKMDLMRTRIRRDGLFRSQTGEWDSNGQAIWTLATHVRRGGDAKLLERHWNHVRRGVGWIVRERRRETGRSPHLGLLPAGFSAEHFGPNDHYFWDNFWSLAGLQDAAWMGRVLGDDVEASRISDEADEYRADLETSIAWAMERCDGGLPSSPYRRMDSASIGNLVAICPLGVVSPDAPWVASTLEHIGSRCLRQGLFYQSIVHTGLNPYLSVQLARVRLCTGDADGAWEILQALVRVASPTWCWPEAIHPRTGGGCMGDGDHGWAAAEFLSLLRQFLVREVPERLELLSGARSEWLDGDGIRLSGATTSCGVLEISARRRRENILVDWNLVRGPLHGNVELVLNLPLDDGRRIKRTLPSSAGRMAFSADGTPSTEKP